MLRFLIGLLAIAILAGLCFADDFTDRVLAIEAAAKAKADRAAAAAAKKACPCKTDCGCPPGKCVCDGGECNCISCGGTICECADPSQCTCEGRCGCKNCMVWCRDEEGVLYLWLRGRVIGQWAEYPGQRSAYYPAVKGGWGAETAPPIKPPEPVRVSYQRAPAACRI
jgi:hypothetical protein